MFLKNHPRINLQYFCFHHPTPPIRSITNRTTASDPIVPRREPSIRARKSLSADALHFRTRLESMVSPARQSYTPLNVKRIDSVDSQSLGSEFSALRYPTSNSNRDGGLCSNDNSEEGATLVPGDEMMPSRLSALAGFKTFMQGLDSHPSVSLDSFIRSAANAVRVIFPGVHHASFCLLSSGRSSVNMYTFIGDGAQKPPQISEPVAAGTMIYHVLHSCKPVFVNDIAASFPTANNGSDIQYMRFVLGLKCIACLPLFATSQRQNSGRILGVLRLGFEHPRKWIESERSLAKQLALVLSNTSEGLGGGSVLSDFDASSGTMSSLGAAGINSGSMRSSVFDRAIGDSRSQRAAARGGAVCASEQRPQLRADYGDWQQGHGRQLDPDSQPFSRREGMG